MSVVGTWRITEMELWAPEDVDLVGAAFVELGKDGMGRFAFIAVEGWMDCRDACRNGRPGVEFSWDGSDDSDPAGGRGWAVLEQDGSLSGRIYFHLGDDSSFCAVRVEDESRGGAKGTVRASRRPG